MSDAIEPALPQLFTPAEVARALQQTERYVTEKARLREWPHRRLARGEVRFSAEDYAAVLELCRVEVTAASTRRLSLAPRSASRQERRL